MPLREGPEPGARRRRGPGRPLASRAGEWLGWWVVLMAFWVVLDDSVAVDELAAGAGAAALGALLVELASYQAAVRIRIRLSWLAGALRLPGQVTGDTVTVFVALWKRLARGEEPRGGFVTEPVRYGPETPEGRMRRALLVGARSLAPGTFVVGIDADRGELVLHKLVLDEAPP